MTTARTAVATAALLVAVGACTSDDDAGDDRGSLGGTSPAAATTATTATTGAPAAGDLPPIDAADVEWLTDSNIDAEERLAGFGAWIAGRYGVDPTCVEGPASRLALLRGLANVVPTLVEATQAGDDEHEDVQAIESIAAACPPA